MRCVCAFFIDEILMSSFSVVYVGRLSSRTRERDLEDTFTKFGRLQRLDLKAGYAFIEYEGSINLLFVFFFLFLFFLLAIIYFL